MDTRNDEQVVNGITIGDVVEFYPNRGDSWTGYVFEVAPKMIVVLKNNNEFASCSREQLCKRGERKQGRRAVWTNL